MSPFLNSQKAKEEERDALFVTLVKEKELLESIVNAQYEVIREYAVRLAELEVAHRMRKSSPNPEETPESEEVIKSDV